MLPKSSAFPFADPRLPGDVFKPSITFPEGVFGQGLRLTLDLQSAQGEAQGLQLSERELARLEAERDRSPAAMAAAAADADAGRPRSPRRRAGDSLTTDLPLGRGRAQATSARGREATVHAPGGGWRAGLGDELTKVTVEAQKLQDAARTEPSIAWRGPRRR